MERKIEVDFGEDNRHGFCKCGKRSRAGLMVDGRIVAFYCLGCLLRVVEWRKDDSRKLDVLAEFLGELLNDVGPESPCKTYDVGKGDFKNTSFNL